MLVTLGDPNGLGPELATRHFSAHVPDAPVVLIGPARSLGTIPGAQILERPEQVFGLKPGLYLLEPAGLQGLAFTPGRPSPAGGKAAGLSLDLACDLLLSGKDGAPTALVTCPLDKAMLKAAGFDFPGHTEFLARRAGLRDDEVVMHLCGPRLRVSLVTTHPPLQDVPGLITAERLRHCMALTCDFAARLGASGPVAVCGLNPHAGEGGTIGDQEQRIIGPAVERAKAEGLDVLGPLPADSLFHRAARGDYAAVLAMYHDQGLGPLKLLHFGEAVNVTLGLPFVRTSVDHGTGYDLVGTGQASTDSLAAAFELAVKLAG